ncbi:MAG: hypothetical protein P8184_16255 [Calditrichia bacterium]
MLFSKGYFRWMLVLAFSAGFLFLNGCAGTRGPQYKAVTVPQIIKWSKEGIASSTIIKRMRRSHTVYRLKADQLAQLKQEGVSDSVINYMQKTYLSAVRRNQALEDWAYWWPGWDGYWYGGPAFGWPYGYWDYEDWGDGD